MSVRAPQAGAGMTLASHSAPPQDFCNAFWSKRAHAAPGGVSAAAAAAASGASASSTTAAAPQARQHQASDEEIFLACRDGYEALMGRMRGAQKTFDEIRALYKERASAEEDYAKRLLKLSRGALGGNETGRTQLALRVTLAELDCVAKTHADVANVIRSLDSRLAKYVSEREARRKVLQGQVEKQWKTKCEHEKYVFKARKKYEDDCILINGLNAQARLSQGRDLDKLQTKMEKAEATVQLNERDYRHSCSVLAETTREWVKLWKQFCDLCQDQEEDKAVFVKTNLWDYANALSSACLADDESAERTREALEQCDPDIEARLFVQARGTGSDILDPLPFVDHSRRSEQQPSISFRTANFRRVTSRRPGQQQRSGSVDDLRNTAARPPVEPQQQPPPGRESPTKAPVGVAALVNANSVATQRLNSEDNGSHPALAAPRSEFPPPRSRSPSPTKNPLAAIDQALSPRAQQQQQQQQSTAASAPLVDLASDTSAQQGSRFTVSPHAFNPTRHASGGSDVSNNSASNRPGYVSASFFQRRPPQEASAPPVNEFVPPTQDRHSRHGSHTSAPPPPEPVAKDACAPSASAPPQAGMQDADDDDPLMQAISKMRALNANASPPTQRSAPVQPAQQQHQQPRHRPGASSQDVISPQALDATRQRPSSPAPVASMMRAPNAGSQQAATSAVLENYGQSFPGERKAHSRADSIVSNASGRHHQHQPPARSPSPTPFAGIGARGRSPSPQPFESPQRGTYGSAQPQGSPARGTSPFGFKLDANGQVIPEGAPSRAPHQRQPSLSPMPPHMVAARSASPRQARPMSMQGSSSRPASPQVQHGRAPSPSMQQQYGAPPQQAAYAPQHRPSGSYGQHAPSPQQYAPPLQYASPQHQYAPPQPSMSPSFPAGYSAAPPPQMSSAPSFPAGYSAAPPQQAMYRQPTHQQPPPPPPQGYSPAGYAPQQPQGLRQPSPAPQAPRAPSLGYNNYGQQYAPPADYTQRQPSPAAQQYRQPSPAPAAPPAPTQTYTEDGKPILTYVRALYEYKATNEEEFSFSEDDIIAVTAYTPDGWWQGQLVGMPSTGGNTFPSNFTTILE